MDYVAELMAIMNAERGKRRRKVIEIESVVAKNIVNRIKVEIIKANRSKPFYITFEMMLRDEKREQYENELYYALGKYEDEPEDWECFLVGTEMKYEMLDEICKTINRISHNYKALRDISAKIVPPFHDLEISINR